MIEIIKAATPTDFLKLVPRLVGYHPVDSIVVVGFREKKTQGAMRVEIEAGDWPFTIAHALQNGMLRQGREIDSFAVIVYTSNAAGQHAIRRVEDVIHALMFIEGLNHLGSFIVTPTAWYERGTTEERSLDELVLPEDQQPPYATIEEAVAANPGIRFDLSDLGSFDLSDEERDSL